MANRFEYKIEFASEKENLEKILDKITKILKRDLGGCVGNVLTTVTILDGTFGEEKTADAEE